MICSIRTNYQFCSQSEDTQTHWQWLETTCESWLTLSLLNFLFAFWRLTRWQSDCLFFASTHSVLYSVLCGVPLSTIWCIAPFERPIRMIEAEKSALFCSDACADRRQFVGYPVTGCRKRIAAIHLHTAAASRTTVRYVALVHWNSLKFTEYYQYYSGSNNGPTRRTWWQTACHCFGRCSVANRR